MLVGTISLEGMRGDREGNRMDGGNHWSRRVTSPWEVVRG